MKETFESEIEQWEKELEKRLSKVKKIPENSLSNNSEENQVYKEFWKKKKAIYEKYGKDCSTQK